MQLACQRFSCQKAVEVCYWTCKFRRKCKDWQKALAGEPGSLTIQTYLEAASAKSGRAFDLQTLASPVRIRKGQARLPLATQTKLQEAATNQISVVSRSALPVQNNSGTRSDVTMLSRAQNAAPGATEIIHSISVGPATARKSVLPPASKHFNPVQNEQAMDQQVMNEETLAMNADKTSVSKTKAAKPKPTRPKPAANGPVYVLLSANGKYRELREADLLSEAATLLKDPSLRLIKGQLLIPTISFKEATADTE